MSGPDTDLDALVGTTVCDKYRIDRLIGQGGMGAVYQATNVAIGKRVALKFLDREAARDVDSARRFQREAEAASAVESAHIVQIFDSGSSEDGLPFLVMELLSGEDLRARLRREGRLELPEAMHIAGQVLRALGRAHEAGIVHRDLKPDNVFLCRRDDDPMFVKLVDFGISKVTRKNATADTLTRRGTVLGTAFYMSPEQAQAYQDIDGRADLYSLGAILYEALAGRPPHTGSAYEAILIDICTKDAEDVRQYAPNVPEAVAKVIERALERDRALRFQSAAELYDALSLAAPGLLRTGGPNSGNALSSSSNAGAAPASTPLPRAATLDDERVATADGTAVRTSSAHASAQVRRTVIIGLLAALGAFSLTVLLMARHRRPPARDAAPTPSAADSHAGLPAASAPRAKHAKVADARAGSTAARDAGFDRERPHQPARPVQPARTKTHTNSRHAHTPKSSASAHTGGVASGLQLNTSPP